MSLREFIGHGVNGGNLLFCGAGFSADCLNFSSKVVGSASPLHKTLNQALKYEFSDMQLAADEYIEKFGEHGLLSLLTEKYSVSKRTKDIDTILKYPWSRVYTTNYDSVISQSMTFLGQPHYVANNTEKPFDVEKLGNKKTWIVHLHGALQKWDINNFVESCVLGRESYLRASANSNWASKLREDYARAGAVFFVGFSNSDFYLAEHLFSAEASRDKVFFINSERSAENRELQAKQKKFGQFLSIGKEKFSSIISDSLDNNSGGELELHSFRKCSLPKMSDDRASVEQQYAFMVSGKDDPEGHFKDILDNSFSYRALRNSTNEIVGFLKNSSAVALVLGGICSGKSLVFEECIMKLQTGGETVFRLRSKYYDLKSEAQTILREFPNCVLAIDDCFSLKEDIREIIGAANASGAKLLLTSRTIAYDSEEDIQSLLKAGTPYKKFDTEILDEQECNSIIDCTDRIGGWGASVSTYRQKSQIIRRENNSRLSGFLLNIFNSQHIRKRFKSELDAYRANGLSAERALILALYLRHIGENVQENVLSEMLQMDSVKVVNSAGGAGGFISYEPRKNGFTLLASINAREALKKFFEQKDVIDSVVGAVSNLEDVRYEPAFKHVLSQLMRYTQLKQVVVDFSEQDRFFDRLSEIWFCSDHVLFWLQWSMAMRDHQKYGRAQQYLDEAYGRAKERGFNTDHLDDQQAGLVLDAVLATAASDVFFRRFQKSIGLLTRMIRNGAVTSHNYLTIQSFGGFFQKAEIRLTKQHADLASTLLRPLRTLVQSRLSVQHDGFVKSSMERALGSIDESQKVLDGIN